MRLNKHRIRVKEERGRGRRSLLQRVPAPQPPPTHTHYTLIIITITNYLYRCEYGGEKGEDKLRIDVDKRLILVKEHPVDDGVLVLWLVLVTLHSPVEDGSAILLGDATDPLRPQEGNLWDPLGHLAQGLTQKLCLSNFDTHQCIMRHSDACLSLACGIMNREFFLLKFYLKKRGIWDHFYYAKNEILLEKKRDLVPYFFTQIFPRKVGYVKVY
jgi:hypothetical protein